MYAMQHDCIKGLKVISYGLASGFTGEITCTDNTLVAQRLNYSGTNLLIVNGLCNKSGCIFVWMLQRVLKYAKRTLQFVFSSVKMKKV